MAIITIISRCFHCQTGNENNKSYNGNLREERLNTYWFMSLEDAKEKLERWRNEYNEYHPHSALPYLPPAECARNHAAYGPLSTSAFSH